MWHDDGETDLRGKCVFMLKIFSAKEMDVTVEHISAYVIHHSVKCNRMRFREHGSV